MRIPSHSLPPVSLTALTEATAAINSTLDFSSVLSTIAELARSVTHAEASTVFSLDPQHKKLVVVSEMPRTSSGKIKKHMLRAQLLKDGRLEQGDRR